MTSGEPCTEAYDRIAPVWAQATDANFWNEHLERRLVRDLLPDDLTGQHVLDAGCAAGSHAAWLVERGCQVTAIDVSPAMVEAAQARLGRAARVELGDFSEPLRYPDHCFDGILCSLALHHVRDIDVPLGDFARLLRPYGWLVVSLDHPAALYDGNPRPDYFATELITDTWSKGGVAVDVSFWRRPLSAVTDALADNGFLVERISEARVDEEARRQFPTQSRKVAGAPTFIVYRAVPDPRGG